MMSLMLKHYWKVALVPVRGVAVALSIARVYMSLRPSL